MRNFPLQFVREETLAQVQQVYASLEEARQTAETLGLSPRTVQENWQKISEHKWLVSEKVGRDIGPRVATLDYLNMGESDGTLLHNPRQTKVTWLARLSEALLANLDCDGPRSLMNFELAMRGTRSLAK